MEKKRESFIDKRRKIESRVKRTIKAIPPELRKLILEDVAALNKNPVTRGPAEKILVRICSGGFWSQSLSAFTFREFAKDIKFRQEVASMPKGEQD